MCICYCIHVLCEVYVYVLLCNLLRNVERATCLNVVFVGSSVLLYGYSHTNDINSFSVGPVVFLFAALIIVTHILWMLDVCRLLPKVCATN